MTKGAEGELPGAYTAAGDLNVVKLSKFAKYGTEYEELGGSEGYGHKSISSPAID